jgi:hypothetical protein
MGKDIIKNEAITICLIRQQIAIEIEAASLGNLRLGVD